MAPPAPVSARESNAIAVVTSDSAWWKFPFRLPGILWRRVCLVAVLSAIAAIPLLNFFALGYVLESQARVGRSGSFRGSLGDLRWCTRIVTIALCCTAFVVPLLLLAGRAADAALVDPASSAAARLAGITYFLEVLVTLHLTLALLRGGTFGCFLRPIKNIRFALAKWRGKEVDEPDRWRELLEDLQFKQRWWLGVRGAGGAILWLLIPTALYASATEVSPGGIAALIVGGLMMAFVYARLAILQTHFVVEERFDAFREWKFAGAQIRKAPLMWAVAVFFVCAAAIPILLVDAASGFFFGVLLRGDNVHLLTSIAWVVLMLPAHLLMGRAYARAEHKDTEARRLIGWPLRLVILFGMALVALLWVFVPLIDSQGRAGLIEHPTFLIPLWFGQ